MFLKALIIVLLAYLCVLEHEKTHKKHTYVVSSAYGSINYIDIVSSNNIMETIHELETYIWNKNVLDGSIKKRVLDVKKID